MMAQQQDVSGHLAPLGVPPTGETDAKLTGNHANARFLLEEKGSCDFPFVGP